MFPGKISKDTLILSPNYKQPKDIFYKDELLNLINRLSNLFKNFTNIVKNSISKKKDVISFIDNHIQFAHKIVNNIINHNYSLEQLKSLNNALVQIKAKTKILNEEQKLMLYLEESDALLKEINNAQKNNLNKLNKYYNYQNILSPNHRIFKHNIEKINKSMNINMKRNKSEEKNNQENIRMNYTKLNNAYTYTDKNLYKEYNKYISNDRFS